MKSFLTFQLADEYFMAAIDKINSIQNYQETIPVPESPSYLKGITYYMGSVLPVIDLRILISFPPAVAQHKSIFLIMEIKRNGEFVNIAFLIDAVIDVIKIDEAEIQKLPSIDYKIISTYINGVYLKNSITYLLVDLEQLIANELDSDMPDLSGNMR